MRRCAVLLILMGLAASACGSDDAPVADDSSATCLAGDPNCEDTGGDIIVEPPPDSIPVLDEGPITISFGGFFLGTDASLRLCDSLAESFPPQCGATVIEIEGTLDVVLEHVAESFGNPDDARINTEQGVYWTDEWINISGLLEDGKLVVS